MDTFRIVLLVVGLVVVLGIYWWETRRRSRSPKEEPLEWEHPGTADEHLDRELQRLSGLVASARDEPSLTQQDIEEIGPPEPAGRPVEQPAPARPVEEPPGPRPTVDTLKPQARPAPRLAEEPVSAVKPVSAASEVEARTETSAARQGRVSSPKTDGGAQEAAGRELIVTVTLLAPQGTKFSGPKLLDAIKKVGMVYGDMGIFHRPAPDDFSGPPLFSLANILQPGHFDLDKIEPLSTPGIAVFMRLPGAVRGSEAFKEMVNAVDRLATLLHASVCDERRRPIGGVALQAMWDKVIAFDTRQSRIRMGSLAE
jgi:cell division protein ZipA